MTLRTVSTAMAISVSAVCLMTILPADVHAAALAPPSTTLETAPGVTSIQYRRGYRGGYRGGYGRGYGYRGGRGVGIGLGLGIAGAIIGSGIAADRYYRDSPSYSYTYRDDDDDDDNRGSESGVSRCEAAFKSFNRSSGTYTTYGGETRRCPYL